MRSSLVLAGIALALVTALLGAAVNDAMDLQQRHEIQRDCERLIYDFLDRFESEHSKIANLMTEDGRALGSFGREAIREKALVIEKRAVVKVNALIATNLLVSVMDENSATATCYVTAYQHVYKDSKREGQAALTEPNSVTIWNWQFKRVKGEWKISTMNNELVLLSERLFRYLPENR